MLLSGGPVACASSHVLPRCVACVRYYGTQVKMGNKALPGPPLVNHMISSHLGIPPKQAWPVPGPYMGRISPECTVVPTR
jgi:hypothetical protein